VVIVFDFARLSEIEEKCIDRASKQVQHMRKWGRWGATFYFLADVCFIVLAAALLISLLQLKICALFLFYHFQDELGQAGLLVGESFVLFALGFVGLVVWADGLGHRGSAAIDVFLQDL
jgi:hypothetical protein